MFHVYVTWRMDGDDFFVTRHDFSEDDISIVSTLGIKQWAEMSFDVEYPDEPNLIHKDEVRFEVISIFYAFEEVRFIL